MRIDVILESNNSPEEIRKLGTLAEACGLGGVWVSNMNDARDPLINFVPLAANTKRIRIGPIAVSPFELHPLKMASSLLSFNEMAGGRGQIVVGAGGGTATAMGAIQARRVRAVRECVEILQAAATGKPVRYQGEIYQVRWYNPSWAVSPPPRIYVGANGPQLLKSAAGYADGIMVSDFVPQHLAWARKIIDASLEANDRDLQKFPISNFWAWHVKDSQEAAEREARIWLAVRGTVYPKYLETVLTAKEAAIVKQYPDAFINAYHRKSPDIEGIPDAIVSKLAHGCTSASSLQNIDREIARMREFQDAGLTEIALRVYDQPADAIRTIAEHLLPALH